MAYDDEDDLFGGDFDLVDEDESDLEEDSELEGSDVDSELEEAEEDSEVEETPKKKPAKKKATPKKKSARKTAKSKKDDDEKPKRKRSRKKDDEPEDEADSDESDSDEGEEEESEPEKKEPEGPPADHVVHLYLHDEFLRTLDRKFTGEEAVAFSEAYNKTSKPYGRRAIPTCEEEQPEESLK